MDYVKARYYGALAGFAYVGLFSILFFVFDASAQHSTAALAAMLVAGASLVKEGLADSLTTND